jgi:hypothetical protein
MTTKDEFIGDLYKNFIKRQSSPFLLKAYFYTNRQRWDRLQEEAKSLGLYFWVHINFNTGSRSILRIGNESDRTRGLFEDSSEDEDYTENIVSSKEIEIHTLPYQPFVPPAETAAVNWIRPIPAEEESVNDPNEEDLLSVDSTSTIHSEESHYYLRARLLGLVAEFPIDLCESSDDESSILI